MDAYRRSRMMRDTQLVPDQTEGGERRLDLLSREILDVMAMREDPIGAESVYYALAASAKRHSAVTIGRRMRELERAGLLAKVSVEGRVITEAGRKALENSKQFRRLRESGEALLAVLSGCDQDNILALLGARLILEGAAASLAAESVTDMQLEAMATTIECQQARVQAGELGIEEDIRLHELIGEASRNPFLSILISLLRRHAMYTYVITKIRSRARQRLVVDHWRILEAIRSRDPVAARVAMESHIRQMVDEVKASWTREPWMATRRGEEA